MTADAPPVRGLRNALSGSFGLIAEIKERSPSQGTMRPENVRDAPRAYEESSIVRAVSVLTNADHFQGSINHLAAVHAVANPHGVPVLRKEFIFDPYQVHEARAYGADAILLIVAMLAPTELAGLMALAQRYWMQCLVEVHDEEELRAALDAGAEIVGINNRDLRTFRTSIDVTERLAPLVPSGKVLVSESGIHSREDIERLRDAGAHAALIGEALVVADDAGARLRGLV